MVWGAIAVGLGAVGIGLSLDAASQAKKALQKRLARRREQMLVALKENDKVFGELGVAQSKHTSQRLRALADSSRGTLTANSMYGGGRGLFAEQASGMRLAAKDKAKAILAIRAAYESDVDTSGLDAARAQIGASVIGLAGAAAGAAAGAKSPATEDAAGSKNPTPASVDLPAKDTTTQSRADSVQAYRDENRISGGDGSRLDIPSESGGADKPKSGGADKPESGQAIAARKRRAKIRAMRAEREANEKRKTKPQAQGASKPKVANQGPMKGATKTENGVKYTYDGTNWVKNPTL